jgi:hypothetical protein
MRRNCAEIQASAEAMLVIHQLKKNFDHLSSAALAIDRALLGNQILDEGSGARLHAFLHDDFVAVRVLSRNRQAACLR